MRWMVIEDALRWAYRDELPKAREAALNGAEAMRRYGPPRQRGGHEQAALAADYWSVPDNMFGVVPDLSATDDPHPDAITIHQAVLSLDAITLDVPEDASAFFGVELHDLAGIVRASVRAAVSTTQLSSLVRRFAIMGVPDCTIDPPERRVMRRANGTPRWFILVEAVDACGLPYTVELDGYDPKAKRPKPGAYQKPYLDPDPTGVLVERCQTDLWRGALDVLAEELAAQLTEVEILPSALPVVPWEAPRPVVLQATNHRCGDKRPKISTAEPQAVLDLRRELGA